MFQEHSEGAQENGTGTGLAVAHSVFFGCVELFCVFAAVRLLSFVFYGAREDRCWRLRAKFGACIFDLLRLCAHPIPGVLSRGYCACIADPLLVKSAPAEETDNSVLGLA